MNRFHVIVSNYKRVGSFVANFQRIKNFDPAVDAVYIFDCSPEPEWKSELEITNGLTNFGLKWDHNLFFVRRRNWGVNHGAQLDYFRCLCNGSISIPQYSAFAQEHYFDLENFVKEDTLPQDAVYDLKTIDARFARDKDVGCIFHPRYGVRVITSNPIFTQKNVFFGDSEILLSGATRRGFLVDGGNFIVRPKYYVNWFKSNPNFLTQGDGTYGFSHVWEARLGQILYDQKIKWFDLYRELEYTSINDLDEIERKLNRKVSKLWYDHRIWYFFYGRDLWSYWPLPFRSAVRYLKSYLEAQKTSSKNTTLTFERP